MERPDNQRVAIGQVVRDLLTAVVRVIQLHADFGEPADEFRKGKLSSQCTLCTPLSNLCLFCVYIFPFEIRESEFNQLADLSNRADGQCPGVGSPAWLSLLASNVRRIRDHSRR